MSTVMLSAMAGSIDAYAVCQTRLLQRGRLTQHRREAITCPSPVERKNLILIKGLSQKNTESPQNKVVF
jgi:hypothetical protein